MATFSTSQQETNRKILEDLQLKKQQLSKTNILGPISTPQLHIPSLQPISLSSENSSRTTAYNLTTQSLGFFIIQDSVCGNSILPVIPRFENTTPVPQATPAKPK
ncbi:hypothetical protein ACFFRR_000754 [Megaselia abdita]